MVEEEGYAKIKAGRDSEKRQACQLHRTQHREGQKGCSSHSELQCKRRAVIVAKCIKLQLWMSDDTTWVTSDPITRLKVLPASPAQARECESGVRFQSLQ